MTKKYFSVAGLNFSVSSPSDLHFGIAEEHFFCPTAQNCVAEFEIIPEDFSGYGNKMYTTDVYSVFEKDNIYFRKFTNKLGDFVLKRGKNEPFKASLYGNQRDLEAQQQLLLQGYFALEVPFLENHTFILHSSLVKYGNCGLVFTGPSGIGKSTQAELWRKHKNADVLNGDRTCIRVYENKVLGYGSIFSGSSGIYRNESAPIKAIIVLEQSDTNKLERLSLRDAFFSIYSQTLNNPWDSEFVSKLISEIETVVSLVPVYKLSCRKDASAVAAVYDEFFR